jgi:RNA-directed DNA polymerase
MATKLASLKHAEDLRGLAYLLGYQPKTLSYILYSIPIASKYKVFEISKKSGGFRTISAPCDHLMQLQRALAKLLSECCGEIFGDVTVQDAVAHGFRRGLSIVTNATGHRARRNVLNVDLDDFFGTINFGRVRGFFISNKSFGLNECVATLIAQIACHENRLPTGSPCSPVISNLIGRVLDVRLVRHAARLGCTYTRYVDDLTFSSNHQCLPTALARREGGASQWVAGKLLSKEVSRAGFSINEKKTRVQYKDSRQDVTGLSVNRRVNTTATYRRYARSMLDRLFDTGSFYLAAKKDAASPVQGTIGQLRGIFGFIDYVDRKVIGAEQALGAKVDSKAWLKRTQAYRRLVFFDDFHQSKLPVILVEGKTDRIHLRSALQRRFAVVPSLAKQVKGGVVELMVRLYGGSSLTTRFFGLDSGTPGLSSFIKGYGELYQGYGIAASANPAVVIVDFDDGIADIKGALKKYGVTLDESKPFQWICHDLYVVCIPKKGAMIEDLYDPAVLSTKLGEKTFNKSNKPVDATEYGKAHFANYVVRPNYKKIDFSGFDQLLQNIEAAVHAHSIK